MPRFGCCGSQGPGPLRNGLPGDLQRLLPDRPTLRAVHRGRSADPAAGTTCSTGAGSDRIMRMRWPVVPREASRDLPGADANGVASGSRST